MSIDARERLLAEREFLRRDLLETPEKAQLTRMSIAARLRKVEAELSAHPANEWVPARARLTFDGLPVIGSHGIFADFAMKAVSSFTDVVASVAASLSAPLRAMGPIPNRDQNQLLITNTAVGSFGFELEEFAGSRLPLEADSAVALALGRAQALLQGTLANDDELADVASEIDPRALEKVRTFLKVLADHSTICALQYGAGSVRFTDVGQVTRSLARLGSDNLRESQEKLHGEFIGALPKSRTFEFQLASNEVIRGKVAPVVEDVGAINAHLHQATQIDVMRTQVGNGRPRYLLTQTPLWRADSAE